MYNSSYGGIESDGTLHKMSREQWQNIPHEEHPENTPAFKDEKCGKKGIFGSSFLKNLEIDDLILIGIAILLLLDGDGDNDIFVFVIAALVLLS